MKTFWMITNAMGGSGFRVDASQIDKLEAALANESSHNAFIRLVDLHDATIYIRLASITDYYCSTPKTRADAYKLNKELRDAEEAAMKEKPSWEQ